VTNRVHIIYKAIDIANWFISQYDRECGDVITHLKLQKLLYYSEAWTQTILNRQLFQESIEAWAHGPVVREVFNVFKDYKWNPLDPSAKVIKFDNDVLDILEQVLDIYGGTSAKVLERMTHKSQPWIDARDGSSIDERCNNKIDKEELKRYILTRYGDTLNREKR
jgi:uncharacterized phage-associated protein